jgi:hypothetical protein
MPAAPLSVWAARKALCSASWSREATPAAGGPLRWRLAEARGGLEGAAGMLLSLQRLYNLYCSYYLLQGIILVLLIVRWLHYISFQPRLSIISGTLALAMQARIVAWYH